MSRKCDICGKGAMQANTISHAHNVSKRKQFPNLRKIRVTVGGTRRRVKTCTRCLKAGKIYLTA